MKKDKSSLKSLFYLSKQGKVMFGSIVMLCMIFITIIGVLLGSVIATNKLNLYKRYGTYHTLYYELSNKQLNDIRNEPSIKELGIATVAGYSKIKIEKGIEKVYIGELNEEFLEYADIDFIEGSWPKTENEVVLEQRVAESLGISKLNDYVTITIIKENEQITKQLKVVGILDDYYSKLHQTYYGSSIRANIPTILIDYKHELINNSEISYSVLAVLSKDVSTYEESQRIYNQLLLKNKPINNKRVYPRMNDPEKNSWYLYSVYINEHTTQLAIYLGIFYIVMIISIIIYFTVNIESKKEQIKIIRSIGATNKQLAIMILARLCPVFLIGIIPGLLIGFILSKPAYNQLRYLTFYNVDYYFVITPIIAITILTISMLIISMWIYSLKICAMVPKRTFSKKKNFLLRFSISNNNDFTLRALRKALFSKKRAILNIVSLTLSISICFITLININKAYLHSTYRKFNDIEIQINEYGNGNIIELEPSFNTELGINKDTLNEINKVKGIKRVIPNRFTYIDEYTLSLSENQISDYFSYIKPQYEEDSSNTTIETFEKNIRVLHELGLDKDMTLFGVNNEYAGTFTGCDYDIKHLSKYVAEGKIDLDNLQKGKEVILVLPPFIKDRPRRLVRHTPLRKTIVKTFKNRNREIQETILKPGDTITLVRLLTNAKKQDSYLLENLILEQRKVKIGAIIRSNGPFEYPNESKLFFYYMPNIIIHNDALAKWTGIEQYTRIGVELDGSVDRQIVLDNVENIIKDDKKQILFSHGSESTGIKITLPSLIIYMPVTLCIAFISMLLIYYTVTTNLNRQKRKYGILRAIGITREQLYKYLMLVTLDYGVYAVISSFIISILYTIYQIYIKFNTLRYFEWYEVIPWFYMLITGISIIFVIYVLTKKLINKFVNESVTKNIRYID